MDTKYNPYLISYWYFIPAERAIHYLSFALYSVFVFESEGSGGHTLQLIQQHPRLYWQHNLDYEFIKMGGVTKVSR